MQQATQTPASPPDYTGFLSHHLQLQQFPIASYRIGDEQVWIKRAGAHHSQWPLRALGAVATVLGLQALRPVPNRGGQHAIATEVRRMHELAARGLRVPQVLAAAPDGFMMRHLGLPGVEAPSLGNAMEAALPAGPQAVLALWCQGVEAIAHVHAQQQCLSQAFARNMVLCPDGGLAYVDFEDDPQAALPQPVCQVRDMLCYAHSTAIYLRQTGALDEARGIWQQWLRSPHQLPATRETLATTVRRLGWLRHLPQDRRWGRDAQRLRAAYDLLTPGPASPGEA